MGLGNSTTDKDQHKTFHSRDIEEEESVQDTSVELVSQTGEGGNRKNAKTQGSKIQHGSRGKQQRERRKLREKRRGTGVVHLENTESTGGSATGEEDVKEEMGSETKKNTEQNEILGKNIEKHTYLYLLLTASCNNCS